MNLFFPQQEHPSLTPPLALNMLKILRLLGVFCLLFFFFKQYKFLLSHFKHFKYLQCSKVVVCEQVMISHTVGRGATTMGYLTPGPMAFELSVHER